MTIQNFSRSLLAGVIGFGLLAVLPGCAKPAGPQYKAEYRMQVTVGPTTHWGLGAAKFAELAKAKTGGRINIKPYYGSQLLKGAQLNSCQMVATGAIDCAFESTINTAPVIPEMNLFSLPFYVRTFANLDRLETGATGRLLFSRLQAKGVEPLGWGENGFRQITNSRRAIAAPEDLKGLKIRVVGSPIFIDIFRHLGADPVNMNWGDAVSAFQQGVVDGQENPCGILTSVQIHQFHRQVSFWNYVIDPLVFYWNKTAWDAFPPDVQAAIREAAAEAGRYQKALARAGLDGDTSLALLKQEFNTTPEIPDPVVFLTGKGMTAVAFTAGQQDAFAQALQPVRDKWEKEIGPEAMRAAAEDLKTKP